MRISWLFFHLLTFLIDAPFLKPVGGIVLLYTQSNPLPSPAEGQGRVRPSLLRQPLELAIGAEDVAQGAGQLL